VPVLTPSQFAAGRDPAFLAAERVLERGQATT
jgi:hypothetical protein